MAIVVTPPPVVTGLPRPTGSWNSRTGGPLPVILNRYGARADQLEDPPILVDLGKLLQVQSTHMRLQIDHVRVVRIVEVEDPERTRHRGVGADRPGEDLDFDVVAARDPPQVVDLRFQHRL